MKKTLFTLLLFSLIFSLNAQTITEKDIIDGAAATYAPNKFSDAPRKVYIASFRAFFHVVASETANSVGSGGKGNSKVAMTVALDGVDVPDFQALTNAAYKSFTDDLKSRGFEILTADDAGKTKFYSEWIKKEGGQVSYAQMPGYVSATPAGYSYFIKAETGKGKEKTTFVDKTPVLSLEMGSPVVIDVAYYFPAFDIDDTSSGALGFSSVKAKVNFRFNSEIKFVTSERAMKYSSLVQRVKGDGINVEAPVFKDKKFREMAVAERVQAFSTAFIEILPDVSKKVTHNALVDHDLYMQETSRLMNEFSTLALKKFYGYALE